MPEAPGLGTIWVNLAANVESFVSSIGSATAAVEKFGSTTSNQSSGLDKLGTQIKQNWVAIAAGAGGAAVAIEAIARQQQQMSLETYKLSESLKTSSSGLREYVTNLAGVNDTAREFLDIMEQGRLQGIRTLDGMTAFVTFWDTVGDSMGRSGAEFARNSQYLKAFGIEAENVGEALDAIGFITNDTTLTLDEFFATMSRSSASIDKSGITLNEFAIAMAKIRDSGASSRQAIQIMNEGLGEMARTGISVQEAFNISNEEMAKYFSQLEQGGGKVEAAAEKWESLITPIEKMSNWLQNMTYRFADALPLLTQFGTLLMVISSGTTMYANFDRMEKAIVGVVRGLSSASAIAPALAGIGAASSGVASGLSAIEVGGAGAFAALVPLETQLAMTEGTMASTTGVAAGLGATLGAIAIPLAAIVAAVAAFAVAYKYNIGGLQEFTDNAVRGAGDLLDDFAKSVKRVTDSIGEDIDNIFTKLGKAKSEADSYQFNPLMAFSPIGMLSEYGRAKEDEQASALLTNTQSRFNLELEHTGAIMLGNMEKAREIEAVLQAVADVQSDSSLSENEKITQTNALMEEYLGLKERQLAAEKERQKLSGPLSESEKTQLKSLVLQTSAEWDSVAPSIDKASAAVRAFFQAHERLSDLKNNLEALKGAYQSATAGIDAYEEKLHQNETVLFDVADAEQTEIEARAKYWDLYNKASPDVKKWFDLMVSGNKKEADAFLQTSGVMKNNKTELYALRDAYEQSRDATYAMSEAQEDLASNAFDTQQQFNELATMMHELGYIGADEIGKWEEYAKTLGSQWATQLLQVHSVSEEYAKLQEQFRAGLSIHIDNSQALSAISQVSTAVSQIPTNVPFAGGTGGGFAAAAAAGNIASITPVGGDPWVATGQTNTSNNGTIIYDLYKNQNTGEQQWRQRGAGTTVAPGGGTGGAPAPSSAPGQYSTVTSAGEWKNYGSASEPQWFYKDARGVTYGPYTEQKLPEGTSAVTTTTTVAPGGVAPLTDAEKARLAATTAATSAGEAAQKTWTAEEYRKAMGWEPVGGTATPAAAAATTAAATTVTAQVASSSTVAAAAAAAAAEAYTPPPPTAIEAWFASAERANIMAQGTHIAGTTTGMPVTDYLIRPGGEGMETERPWWGQKAIDQFLAEGATREELLTMFNPEDVDYWLAKWDVITDKSKESADAVEEKTTEAAKAVEEMADDSTDAASSMGNEVSSSVSQMGESAAASTEEMKNEVAAGFAQLPEIAAAAMSALSTAVATSITAPPMTELGAPTGSVIPGYIGGGVSPGTIIDPAAGVAARQAETDALFGSTDAILAATEANRQYMAGAQLMCSFSNAAAVSLGNMCPFGNSAASSLDSVSQSSQSLAEAMQGTTTAEFGSTDAILAATEANREYMAGAKMMCTFTNDAAAALKNMCPFADSAATSLNYVANGATQVATATSVSYANQVSGVAKSVPYAGTPYVSPSTGATIGTSGGYSATPTAYPKGVVNPNDIVQPQVNAPLNIINPTFQQPVDVQTVIKEWEYSTASAAQRAGYY
jgi:hypothetical protein